MLLQVPLCLLVIIAIAAIGGLALLFEAHAPVWTIILLTPVAYSGTWTSLGLVNIGNTWCALRTGKNAVGSITAAIRTVLGVAWAISPVLHFQLYSLAPPSAATLAAYPSSATGGGRAAIPLALCAFWYSLYGLVLFITLKAGHPVKPPSPPPKKETAAEDKPTTPAEEQPAPAAAVVAVAVVASEGGESKP